MSLFRKFIIILTLLTSSLNNLFSQWVVNGGLYNIYEHTPDYSTGVKTVYILYGDNNLSIEYDLSEVNSSNVKVFRYSESALNGEELKANSNNDKISIDQPLAGYGYFLEIDDARTSYIWIINYKDYELSMESLRYYPENSDCDFSRLIFNRKADNIIFRSITGTPITITRYVDLEYSNLKSNESEFSFESYDISEQIQPTENISIEGLLCNTIATIKGDQFLKFWGIEKSISSDEILTSTVEGMSKAEMQERDYGNELDKNLSDFSGSAPINMDFYGIANYPVTTYQAWEISKDQNFEIIEATYRDQDLSYSFVDEGTTYVRYVISNADASCDKVVTTYTIECSESSLEVPNVFTPDSPSGNNREFKVAYRSIVKFKGWVFNRWGNQLFHWTDPGQGWDGKYNGKLVPTGAYFYVIEAEGVGGKKYKLKGDINVIRTKE